MGSPSAEGSLRETPAVPDGAPRPLLRWRTHLRAESRRLVCGFTLEVVANELRIYTPSGAFGYMVQLTEDDWQWLGREALRNDDAQQATREALEDADA